jgi:hypothetical protein
VVADGSVGAAELAAVVRLRRRYQPDPAQWLDGALDPNAGLVTRALE